MSGSVTVSVVILNHNDNANALRLTAELAEYEAVTHVCVVDNSGATGLAGSEDVFRNPKADWLPMRNEGYARCNNAGIAWLTERYGAPDYLVISNTDVEVEERSMEQCAAFLEEHPGYAAVAPRMFRPDGTPHHLSGWKERTTLCDVAYSAGLLSRLLGMYRETYPDDYWKTPYSPVDCVNGSFFMIRGPVFRQMGYFDEHTFLYYEEDILGFRLKRMGCRLAVLNDCRFIHYENVTVARSMNLLKKYVIMQRSRLYFHRHYRRVGPGGYAALCAATCLGYVEKAVKTFYYRFIPN